MRLSRDDFVRLERRIIRPIDIGGNAMSSLRHFVNIAKRKSRLISDEVGRQASNNRLNAAAEDRENWRNAHPLRWRSKEVGGV